MGLINGKGNTLNRTVTVEDGSIGANAFIQSNKTYNYVDMDNDMTWFRTISSSDGKTFQKSDSEHSVFTWIPVSAGDVIMTSKTMHKIIYYDSNKNVLSNEIDGGNKAYNPHTVPNDGTAFARVTLKAFEFWGMSDNAKEGDNVCVYKTNAEYPCGDRKPYIPSTQINGELVGDEFFNNRIPSDSTDFVRAMKCKTIKALNRKKGLIRFGSFNIRGTGGEGVGNWKVIRQELMDWGINICGFQEVSTGGNDVNGNPKYSFGEAMKNFQFPYSDTIGVSDTGKRLLSDCEVLESTEVVYANELSTGNAYLHCTVKLPNYRNARNWDKTMSIYVAHFSTASNVNHAEVAELCEAIQADTAEYKIVLADTNGFIGATDENPYSRTWQILEEAGMSPAIDDVTHPTVTVPHEEFKPNNLDCIDNVFFTSNIKCVNWDIINSYDYPNPESTYGYVSDHCMIFADLMFDYMQGFEDA